MNEPIDAVGAQIRGLRVRAHRCRRIAGNYSDEVGAQALENEAARIEAQLDRVIARLGRSVQ